ncbi:MAG: DNA polymerase IV [Candidatus Micrarchaeota archaeon]|nr:DNA polymerase IV [Candidatus Micrarchaeota archaeon]
MRGTVGLILLVDMDSFFASCEQLKRPELKDKAFVVGTGVESRKEKSVVQTASYAARKFGIHSAMPFSMALKLKPDIIYLPSDDKFYEQTSEKIVGLLKSYRMKMEVMSIDEMALDSGTEDYPSARMIAEAIKSRISNEIGLQCTIGISTSVVYAKMVCDAFKPNRIGIVKRAELKAFLADKDVIEILGVGGKTKEKLNKMGITKVSELAKVPATRLVDSFGRFGAELSRIAKGEDETGVVEGAPAISIGRETTLDKETDDINEVAGVMARLAKEAIEELGKRKLWYRNVASKARYTDFTLRTKARRLSNYTDSYETALNTSTELLRDLLSNGKVRKVGIRLSEFSRQSGQAKL